MSTIISPASPEDLLKSSIKEYLAKGSIIPVIGRGVVTFGEKDEKLYPWLLAQLAVQFGLPKTPVSLHAFVCDAFEHQRHLDDIQLRSAVAAVLSQLREQGVEPGPLVRNLAALSQCKYWFALGFDPFLERALELAYGQPPLVWDAFKADTDLPNATDDRPVLAYLFGKAGSFPGSFHLWDADAIDFVTDHLPLALSSKKHLQMTLHKNHLLFIGAELSDWPLRFLLRVLDKGNLEHKSSYRFIAEGDNGDPNDAWVFFRSVNQKIASLRENPTDFAKWLGSHAPKSATPSSTGSERLADSLPRECIFISYEHTDRPAAQRIARKLQGLGCHVWLDIRELQGGDDYERGLQRAVDTCGFFVSIVSRASESRDEGYFIKERKWAAKRSESMRRDRRFYIPVMIDELGTTKLANEPHEFDTKHIERALDGELRDEFAARLAELQRERLARK